MSYEVFSSAPTLCMNDFSSASPKVMAPRQSSDTLTPEAPSFLYFICSLDLWAWLWGAARAQHTRAESKRPGAPSRSAVAGPGRQARGVGPHHLFDIGGGLAILRHAAVHDRAGSRVVGGQRQPEIVKGCQLPGQIASAGLQVLGRIE